MADDVDSGVVLSSKKKEEKSSDGAVHLLEDICMDERSTKRGQLCLLSVIIVLYLLCLFVFQGFPLFVKSVA